MKTNYLKNNTMRRITLILAVIGMVTLGSCSNNDDVDNDTIAEVFEFEGVNFLPNDYTVVLNFPRQIYTTDMVLVYRLAGSAGGQDLWKPLPETYYFDDGTMSFRYDFDFRTIDAEVRLEGYDLANLNNNFKINQVLRVLAIPAFEVNKKGIDLNDYNAVVKAFNIDESKVVKIRQ